VLDRLQVLGRPGAGVEPGLVPGGPVPDELDVGLRLGNLALDVGQGGPGPDQLAVEGGRLPLELGQPGQLRQVLPGVRDLVQARVDRLQVEQAPLA
jgi:hypothetical protein